MFYTYVLESQKDGRWYSGFTKDLRKRFMEHGRGKVASTKRRGPFILIYYEACINASDAVAREKYFKTGMGKRFLRNRMKRFLSLTGEPR
jgi:putative endonuclease